jgi:hypothetical protein
MYDRASGTGSGTDTLVVDVLQNLLYLTFPSEDNFGPPVYGAFGGPIALAGTSASQQGFANGTPLQSLGPFSPPPNLFSGSASGTVMLGLDQNPLLQDRRATATFGAGSEPGAYITISTVPLSTIPEPSTGLIAVSGIVLLFAIKRRATGSERVLATLRKALRDVR